MILFTAAALLGAAALFADFLGAGRFRAGFLVCFFFAAMAFFDFAGLCLVFFLVAIRAV
jgi:hypothetical protein